MRMGKAGVDALHWHSRGEWIWQWSKSLLCNSDRVRHFNHGPAALATRLLPGQLVGRGKLAVALMALKRNGHDYIPTVPRSRPRKANLTGWATVGNDDWGAAQH